MKQLTPIACLLCTAFAGCEQRSTKLGVADTTPKLGVAQPVQREVTDFVDYTGRTNAKHNVIVQPRATGYLVAMPFKEGDFVNQGEILFRIDPKPYQAQLKAAAAAVAQNVATLTYAKATNERFKAARKKQPSAVSERELDQYQAQEEQALANLDLAKANQESAKLNLEYTEVHAPISGQISRYYLTLGNLVNQDVTQLTTLVSMNPMYVNFDMDEPTLLRIKQAIREGKVTLPQEGTESMEMIAARTILTLGSPFGPLQATGFLIPGRLSADMKVLMALSGDETFKYEGTINFFDNQVNPGTGSIQVRGRFSNQRIARNTYLLAPGMFVRVRLPIGQPQQRLLVIDRAIISDQGRKYIFVLNGDNKVKRIQVTIGSLQPDGLRVVYARDLQKDDWVLIGGLQQVRQDMVIEPDRVSMPTLETPATPIVVQGAPAAAVRGKRK